VIAWLSLGLLFVASPIAVHAEDARDLPRAEVAELLGKIGRAIERRTGVTAQVRPFEANDRCSRGASCRRFIYDSSGAEHVVYVRLIGVPTRVRVIADLVGPKAEVIRSAQVDVERRGDGEPSERLDALAISLFPEGAEPTRSARKTFEAKIDETPPIGRPSTREGVATPLSPPEAAAALLELPIGGDPTPTATTLIETEHKTWPWWIVGGSVAVGTAAVYLGIQNVHLRDEGSRPGVPPARLTELEDDTLRTALGANVLFGLAAAGLVTGTVLLLTD
jgi:hypothetical protein